MLLINEKEAYAVVAQYYYYYYYYYYYHHYYRETINNRCPSTGTRPPSQA